MPETGLVNGLVNRFYRCRRLDDNKRIARKLTATIGGVQNISGTSQVPSQVPSRKSGSRKPDALPLDGRHADLIHQLEFIVSEWAKLRLIAWMAIIMAERDGHSHDFSAQVTGQYRPPQ